MNNNRSNNRRRGRGNRNQSGGGNQANRIDSRARGNAPQLLDKYKKLAQDAQHNGDRVQTEYFLQFADHYFRVIADNKARQDEQRVKRSDERGQSDDDDGYDDDGEDRRRDARAPRARRNQRDDDTRRAQGARDEEGPRYEPEENPFTPESGEEGKPKRRVTRRKKPAESGGEIDMAALPPSIAEGDDTKPAPRRRRKTNDADGDSKLSAVG